MKPEHLSEKEVGGRGKRQKQEEQVRQEEHHICVSESAVHAACLSEVSGTWGFKSQPTAYSGGILESTRLFSWVKWK